MKYGELSHRHGKELLLLLHEPVVREIEEILSELPPFSHGVEKRKTAVGPLKEAFREKGWQVERPVDFGTSKSNYIDLWKDRVAVEMEFSKFEMFLRDFFRFLILYENLEIDAGVIITLDETAFARWGNGVSSYQSSRASLGVLRDFLVGRYSSSVRVPLWCIGIE